MSAAGVDHNDFFANTALPDKFDDTKKLIQDFIDYHRASKNKVVLVSSGGTTVPLESRTVRFIDNFSVGTRGSASAEYFLKHGYAVLFLHRLRSLEPFSRRLGPSSIMPMLQMTEDSISVKSEHDQSLRSILKQYESAMARKLLLLVDFTSLGEYLHLLRASSKTLHPLGSSAMLYLAAAVSDFYIPKHEMPEHKIQSSTNKPLQLSLQLVPKMLEPLVKEWVPHAFVVSFKLETDSHLLVSKARTALEKYHHQLVIANLLDTRKFEVTMVTQDSEQPIKLMADDLAAGTEIEEKIVQELVQRHSAFCSR